MGFRKFRVFRGFLGFLGFWGFRVSLSVVLKVLSFVFWVLGFRVSGWGFVGGSKPYELLSVLSSQPKP